MIKVNFSPKVDNERAKTILAEIAADPMGGFLTLPKKYDPNELAQIKVAAKKIQEESECLVCIGIGGSYLGHRAIIEALGLKSETEIN